HALRQVLDFAIQPDAGLCKKPFGFCAVESRMHAGDEIECLRNLYPAWKNGNISNEAHIAHEQIAFFPGIASEDPQFPFVGNQPEDGVERRRLACTVGPNEAEDATLFDQQINAVDRDRRPERLAQAVCFNACHSISAPLLCQNSVRISKSRVLCRSAILSRPIQAAESSPGPVATLRREIAGARLSAEDCARLLLRTYQD